MEVNCDDLLADAPCDADYGKLENGLTYYVRLNSRPQRRAALALVVNVGSVLEEDGEQGVAHLIEHLAFSATTQYSNHDIVKFLESIGAEFGACQMASTTSDDTSYEIDVPIDKPGLLSKAIGVLAEFSSNIRLSAEDLEKERGVILEEYKQGRHAGGRMSDANSILVLEGSKYAERLPIGSEKVIQEVSSETVKRFYRKWYHLKNMAVIAVGDFTDTQNVVELIKTHFGCKVSATDYTEIPRYLVPFHQKPRISCFVESEALVSSVNISWKLPMNQLKTVKDYRNSLVQLMFYEAINARFRKISRRDDPPFISCVFSGYAVAKPIKGHKMTSQLKEKGILNALESMLTEIARVRLHGFSEREISAVQRFFLSNADGAYLQRHQHESSYFRKDYSMHFLLNKPVIGFEEELRLRKALVPDISIEVSKYAEIFRTSYSCCIYTTEPQGGTMVNNVESAVSRINSLEEAGDILPWIEDNIPNEIISAMPNPGSVVKESEYSAIGATELIMTNGMRVCYKCTDFLANQVVFTGYAYGGLHELPANEYVSCSAGVAIANKVGILGYRPSVLESMLDYKDISYSLDVGKHKRTFNGGCSSTELETALQLVYRLFATSVVLEEEDIKNFEESHSAKKRKPITAIQKHVWEIVHGNSCITTPRNSDLLNADPIKACEYFNKCFKDPSTFTVVIVGNINPALATPLILRYLGGIPKPSEPILKYNPDNLKGLQFAFPNSVVREIFYTPMVEAQCSVEICFPFELREGNLIEDIRFIEFVSKLLELKMIEHLRFNHGKIYTAQVHVGHGDGKPLRPSDNVGVITVTFSCDPSEGPTLVDIALDEILCLQEEGPSEEDISTVLEIGHRTREIELQENDWWLARIVDCYQSMLYSGDVGATYVAEDEIRTDFRRNLTPETAQIALKRILPYPCKKKYIALIQMPEAYRFKFLKSVVKKVGSVAGLLALGFTIWRHSRRSSNN